MKNLASKVWSTVYFSLVFLISTYTFTSLILWLQVHSIQILGVELYSQDGEIFYKYLNPKPALILGIASGILFLIKATKKSRLRKLTPYFLIVSIPLSFFAGIDSHLQQIGIEKAPERMKLLEKKYGDKIYPCKVLRPGDARSKVLNIYGEPGISGAPAEKKVTPGSKSYNELFWLPYPGPSFSVEFDTHNQKIISIECQNEEKERYK